MQKDKKIDNLLLKYLKIMVVGALFLAITPDAALAYDFKEGALDILDLAKIVVLIVILIYAMNAFFAREIGKTLMTAIVGAILIAITEIDTIKALGKSFLNLVTGG